MESICVGETPSAIAGNDDEQNTESSENFQKFIYELFERNGILNDLRAYLRGHIVNVLKSTQTGDTLPCQKHFTQRLKLTYQALNILIAEYLLRLEFSYSLSVFVSEIPLANMVFAFAKTLMLDSEGDHEDLKFKDSDVWGILNYLGVKCDSEHASDIIEMYRSDDNTPLLLCILKCIPMYNRQPTNVKSVNSSDESIITSSGKSSESNECKHAKTTRKKASYHDKCKHYAHCKYCQSKIARVKEKYRKKKENLAQNMNECNLNSTNVEYFMKNIDLIERSLTEEMFQQLKTVYDAEIEMMKVEEENRIKRSIANHAIRLQKRRDEMETCFKAREQELERNVQQKKKFLWGLARALREQHAHMMRAMRDVKIETKRLSAKEDSLKTQLADADKLLKQRGEEMRSQISDELVILENHLESMKRERDNISRERTELEQLKNITESNCKLSKIHNIDSEEVKNHHELLKNELNILKKYVEATKLQPKCVIERSTITDLYDVNSRLNVALNNCHEVEFFRNDDDKLKSNQVINDLKKSKNVNFSQSNLDEIYRERSRDRSRSSASSEAGDANNANFEDQTVRRLNEENERLKTFAKQQREHIEELMSQQARLNAELTATRFRSAADSMANWRPRTAPTVMPRHSYHVERLNTSASANPICYGWRKGAGEELSLFSNAQPRILLPGDVVPFIGVLRDRHVDCRRHLINQWRMLRRRVSPLVAIAKPRSRSPARRDKNTSGETINNIGLNVTTSVRGDTTNAPSVSKRLQIADERPLSQQRLNTTVISDVKKNRERSPKSVLREAKQKLKNKDTFKDEQPHHSREKSPNTMLREAKLRLRKLEIEAEAVEQSYFEFRKRQSRLRQDRSNYLQTNESVAMDVVGEIDSKQRKSIQKLNENPEILSQNKDIPQLAKIDFEKYLKGHQIKFDIGEAHFKNRNTAAVRVNPIPEIYRNINELTGKKNYLETPLTEFRKLYNSAKRPVRIEERIDEHQPTAVMTSDRSENSVHSGKDALSNAKNDRKAELEILKENTNKIHNLEESIIIDNPIEKRLASPQTQRNECESENTKSNRMELESSLKSETAKEKLESPKSIIDKNILSVEVDSIIEENNTVGGMQNEGMLVVQNSIDNRDTKTESDIVDIRPQMNIFVSPKNLKEANDSPKPSRSVSPEEAAKLTRNDVLDAIFHTEANDQVSSTQMHLELSNDDDLSADIDNYNSRSDYENEIHSPVSILKTSEDENFWES